MTTQKPYHHDDIAVWPDGSWASLGEVWAGECDWKSDDYEKVRLEDVERLVELNLAFELGLRPK